MNVDQLEPRRHAPPPGWPVETFEVVTTALAQALLTALRRLEREESDTPER